MWVGLGAVARYRGIGWRSGLADVFGVYYNRHVLKDPFGHYYYRGALYNRDYTLSSLTLLARTSGGTRA